LGAGGDGVMNAAAVPIVVQRPQRSQRRNSQEMPPRRPVTKSSQDEKERFSLVGKPLSSVLLMFVHQQDCVPLTAFFAD
jgi:hypothetical protein